MIKRATCKINIGLNILRRRADGFHELQTVMYPVLGLYDDVRVDPLEGEQRVEFSCDGIEIDCSADDNLCVRAARLMQQQYGCGAVAIGLTKRVPFGAGLAGGSSDAVMVVLAMNELFDLALDSDTLIDIAAQLGSDTPFFVLNTPQLCSGRGEVMQSVELSLAGWWLVMVKPHDIGVSTREAYSGVKPNSDQPSLAELITLPIEQWQAELHNGFEPHIFEAHPRLGHIKQQLLDAGATYAAMSGSGSTIFGLFADEQCARSVEFDDYTPYIFELS